MNLSSKFHKDQSWFINDISIVWYMRSTFGLYSGIGRHWGFLTGDLTDRINFDIMDHVSRWLGITAESLMKIRHYLAKKKSVPSWCVGARSWFGFSLNLKIGLSRTTISKHVILYQIYCRSFINPIVWYDLPFINHSGNLTSLMMVCVIIVFQVLLLEGRGVGFLPHFGLFFRFYLFVFTFWK